ncbi:MAG: hypothetical protein GY861_18830 [bacterium]|nr:hypothetical protein [bacterium]
MSLLKQTERFIKSDFDSKYFTHSMYDYYKQAFGFISHYNKEGFYFTRFNREMFETLQTICTTNFREPRYCMIPKPELKNRITLQKHFKSILRQVDPTIYQYVSNK